MVVGGEITSRGAKDILAEIAIKSASPMGIAKEKGLLQENNEDALRPIVQQVIDDNEKIVTDYKGGKDAALQGLVGQVMKASKGSANPALALKLLKDMIAHKEFSCFKG